MKTLTEYLSDYASYHRDNRNIATHFVGIPLIVVAVAVLLSRPVMDLQVVIVSPAVVVSLLAGIFYLRLDVRLGLVMCAVLAASVGIGRLLAAESTVFWLTSGLGMFVVGWIIQFIGHYYEGKKPAFVDDLIGLAIGPLFVAAEVAFKLGLRDELNQAIEQRAGPVRN
ncbi:MAG: DUF962 domain-containing protein [Hahellaceae bacterium]|nr:DUF962 domain-containing protein [Hahellaceae bacterium]MCP5169977.1 DUF962 domain-containing protein [Hahellaceae bacterium]